MQGRNAPQGAILEPSLTQNVPGVVITETTDPSSQDLTKPNISDWKCVQTAGPVLNFVSSQDGQDLYVLCAAPSVEDNHDREIIVQHWDMGSTMPKMVGRTSVQEGKLGGSWKMPEDPIDLMPHRRRLATLGRYGFLCNGQHIRLGKKVVANPLYGGAQGVPGPLGGPWAECSHSAKHVAVSRRLNPRLQDVAVIEEVQRQEVLQAKRNRRKDAESKRRSRRERWRHVKKTYDDEFDFDALSDSIPSGFESGGQEKTLSEHSSSAALSVGFSGPASGSDGADVNGSNDECSKSLSDGCSESSGDSSISGSSLSSLSDESDTRLMTMEYLTSSGNSLHYGEAVMLPQTKICDDCEKIAYRWLHCFSCSEGYFDICLNCLQKGQWCYNKQHEMVEADEDGPIAVRKYEDWLPSNDIRVYEAFGNNNCLFEFSSEDERLLPDSRPALHPTAPICAWPLSPNKILFASFSDDKQKIFHKLRPLVDGGRKISVDVRFSSCGTYVFVACIEAAVPQMKKSLSQREPDLFMQVVMLRFQFDGQDLSQPVTAFEQHLKLAPPVLPCLQELPVSWTWAESNVYLTLTRGPDIDVYRISLNIPDTATPPAVSICKKTFRLRDSTRKAELLRPHNANDPLLMVALHSSSGAEGHQTQLHYSQVRGDWTAIIPEENTKLSAGLGFLPSQKSQTHSKAYITPLAAASRQDPKYLNSFRSEIRLLCLLPGSLEDEIKCNLVKVSLDDLDVARAMSDDFFSPIDGKDVFSGTSKTENEKDLPHSRKARKTRDESKHGPIYDAEFEPRVLEKFDYTKPEYENMTMFDGFGKIFKKYPGLAPSIRTFGNGLLDHHTSVRAQKIIEDREQRRRGARKPHFHPKYSYEALSYVWGESQTNQTITLDGNPNVSVTDNLFAALRRARWQTQQRMLWVDAICIDQQNLEERNSQVQMMNRIYKSAVSVLVWLGDADKPKPSTIVECNEDRRQTAEDKGEAAEDVDDADDDMRKWQKQVLQEVLDTASLQWWKRTWIIQEFVLANSIRFLFGEVEVDFTTFESKLDGIWKPVRELGTLFSLRQNRSLWQYQGSIGETALLARHCLATNDRDKVYGILSLVQPGQADRVKPDYGLEPWQVFAQATVADLTGNIYDVNKYDEASFTYKRVNHDLASYPMFTMYSDDSELTGQKPDPFRILNWAKRTSTRMKKDLPSWAVDFSDPACFKKDAHLRSGGQQWTVDGNGDLHKQFALSVSECGKKLTVRGMIFDRIKHVVSETPIHDYKNRTANLSKTLRVTFADLPSTNPFTLVTGATAKPRTDGLRTYERPNWIITETSPGNIWTTADDFVSKVLPNWDPNEHSAEVQWSVLGEVDTGACEIQGCRCTPSQFFLAWDSCVGLPRDSRNMKSLELARGKTSPWENYCRHLTGDGKEKDPYKEEDMPILVTTACGFLGLVREDVREGDLVVLFYGADIPVVLRRHGDHYTYEGRAWINGIMLGELWNIYEDPMLETRDFEIR